jgi:hypothetical protein
MHRVAVLVFACVPALLVACYHPGVQPRTGEVARSGQLVGGADWAPYTAAPAQVDDDTEQRFQGDFGARSTLGWQLAVLVGGWPVGEFGVGIGVTDRLQLGTALSIHRAEMELRLGLLGERWGDPFSMAVSVAGGSWFLPRDPGARAGVDLSKRFGRRIVLGGLHASHGPARYAHQLSSSYEDCPLPTSGGGLLRACSFQIDRTESRLSATLGAAFHLQRARSPKNAALLIALVPYAVLDSSATKARCSGCDPLVVDTFESGWGVTLVVGVHVLP